jgi:hypothetical protein
MKPYNIASRTVMTDPNTKGPHQPYRDVAWTLQRNSFHDVALLLHARTGDDRLLARTATDDRIDQAWVTTPLIPTTTNYTRHHTPNGASDHDGIKFTLDTSRAQPDSSSIRSGDTRPHPGGRAGRWAAREDPRA